MAGSPSPAAGSPRPVAGSPRPVAGSPRPVAGSRRPVAGSPRPVAAHADRRHRHLHRCQGQLRRRQSGYRQAKARRRCTDGKRPALMTLVDCGAAPAGCAGSTASMASAAQPMPASQGRTRRRWTFAVPIVSSADRVRHFGPPLALPSTRQRGQKALLAVCPLRRVMTNLRSSEAGRRPRGCLGSCARTNRNHRYR